MKGLRLVERQLVRHDSFSLSPTRSRVEPALLTTLRRYLRIFYLDYLSSSPRDIVVSLTVTRSRRLVTTTGSRTRVNQTLAR